MKSFPEITKVKGISNIRYMPRRGKIRLGIKCKNPNGKEYPKETDYFVCPEEVSEVFGEKPKRLEIMFPVNQIEKVFPQSYKWYGGSVGVKCKGDGEIAWRKQESGLLEQIECPCEKLDGGGCSLRGSVLFMIPKVSMGWVYQLDTGSFHSTVSINSGIDYVQDMVELATGVRRFALIPLILERVPQKTGGGGKDGTKAQQIHYIVKLYSMLNEEKMKEIKNNLANRHSSHIALPEPEDINPELDTSQEAIQLPPKDSVPEGLMKDNSISNEPIIDGSIVDNTPEDEPPVTIITRERTTEISFMGAKTMTAGISSKTASEVFDYKNTGPDQVNELKDFLAYLGLETIRDLTEEEGVLFLDGKKPETPEEKPPKEKKAAKKKRAASKTKDAFGEEESSLNKQFWAIANEIGVPKNKADNLKQLFYTFNKVKSFHDLTVEQWLYSIDMLEEYKKDPPSLFSTLDSLVIGDK